MRPLWILLALAACGDNTEPPRLVAVTAVPAGTTEIVLDGDDAAVVRDAGGKLRRFADGRWQPVPLAGAVDWGSDDGGTLLVLSPPGLYQVGGSGVVLLAGAVPAGTGMPVQVPSGNFYVKELAGAGRSFVLAPNSGWIESPPMFASRPVRAFDRTLYAAAPGGVERFEAGGARPLAVSCEALGKASCTHVAIGGADGDRLYLAGGRDVIVVRGTLVERVPLPGGAKVVRLAAGKDATLVLATYDGPDPQHALYLVDLDGTVTQIESLDDPPAATTQLLVDRAGALYAATQAISAVMR